MIESKLSMGEFFVFFLITFFNSSTFRMPSSPFANETLEKNYSQNKGKQVAGDPCFSSNFSLKSRPGKRINHDGIRKLIEF